MAQEGEGKGVYAKLPEGAKKVPDDVQEALNQELKSRSTALLERIIDRAASDPAWKNKLLSDPEAAYDEAGLSPEIEDLNPATLLQPDVIGQIQAVGALNVSATYYYQACLGGVGPIAYTYYGWYWKHIE